MKEDFYIRHECIGCKGSNLTEVLDLGAMPLANAFVSQDEIGHEDRKFPLSVSFCNDCSLLQVMQTVNPDILFSHYDYITSASSPLIPHFEDLGHVLANEFIESDKDLFVDIGGNDGTLLNAVKDRCRVLNIDPAKNIADLSKSKGIETLTDFFGTDVAKKVVDKFGTAKVVTANNVFAHIANIRDAFEGAGILIGDDGVLVIEVHWVGNLIGDGGFDQIYHEHLCYWSLTALKNLIDSLGMNVFRVELIPIHGRSMRVFISRSRDMDNSVEEILEEEWKLGLNTKNTFLNFGKEVEKNRKVLLETISRLKSEGKSIVAYGAPAKGNTLLNYFGLDSNLIDYAIDTTPMKQGKYTPGVHIPILHPDTVKKDVPDCFLLLAWNYADAIIQKENSFIDNGGKFIVPVPTIKIIDKKKTSNFFLGNHFIKTKKAFKEGGVFLFLKRLIVFFFLKLKSFLFLIFRPLLIKFVNRIKHKGYEYVLFTIFRFPISFFLKPAQVKSEFLSLSEMVKKRNPNIIVEIGTANGGTLLTFSSLMHEEGTIISIDLPGGSFGGGYSRFRVPFYRSFARKKQAISLFRENSHDINTLNMLNSVLKGRKIDFLFIDGDHTYEGVKKDFFLYRELVSENGMIAFHDIAVHPENSGCEVHRFWEEIKMEYKKEKILEFIEDREQGWGGIGIIFF